MTQRFEIQIRFNVDKDMVPGVFHKAEDWVEFITREYMRQTHYNACYEVESVVEYDSDDMKFVALPMVEEEQTYAAPLAWRMAASLPTNEAIRGEQEEIYAEAPWLRNAWDGFDDAVEIAAPVPHKWWQIWKK